LDLVEGVIMCLVQLQQHFKTAPTTISAAANTPVSSFSRGDINLTHLNFLVEDVDIAGQPMAITHITAIPVTVGDASGRHCL
jgi:hypothetical protein